MAIGPIELQGMNLRTQDFQGLKNSENQKPIMDNMNYQTQVQKNVETNVEFVHDKDSAEFSKGDSNQNKNEYAGDGGRNRKKNKDGKVIDKSVRSFDMKV